ncbi:hypothetical protein QBC40DRAFT_283177 [Triangularia verruculosa]|uniref:MARVEL domain-containing protein n=1 Tax=Triangularia verruculosa TaxID=2587418 RepID=A0AAN7ARS1_9PEZI|nr:hypothetical protein QBC40DRAFT_283177 [Triangularia verruculosa]
MSEVKPPVQYASAPVPAPAGNKEHYVQQTPVWVVVVRSVQIFFSLVILGMAGTVIHDVMIEELAFGIACAVFTWIVVGYILITEKVSGARAAYNIWAVLSLDFLMAILWLAALGSIAARRARFVYNVNVGNCYDDGSAVSSKTCNVYKRSLEKRGAILTQSGLGLTSGAAGLSALMWILFIVTLVYHGHTFRLWHQANKKPADAELNAQGAPMLATQQQTAPAPGPVYNNQQQYQPQTQYAQQYPPQQQQQQPQQFAPQQAQQFQQQQQAPFQPSPVGTPSPVPTYQAQYQAPQPTGSPQPYYPQQQQPQQPQQQQPQQQPYPQAAEAPGHPYYPPQQ